MKSVRVTDVRNNFQEVIDRVHYTRKEIIISKRNKPWVIIKPLPQKEKDFDKLLKNKK